MGAEFALTCIPLVDLTEGRLQVLWEIVDGLTENNFHDAPERWEDMEAWSRAVREAVESLVDVEDRCWRDVNHLTVAEGQPYDVLFAGGFSYGPDPSDTFTHFETLRSCLPVISQLAQWAKEDKETEGRVIYSAECRPLPR